MLLNIKILNKLLEQEDLLLFSCLLMDILVSIIFLHTCVHLLACPGFRTTDGARFATNYNTKEIEKQENEKCFCSMPESQLSFSYFLEIILFHFNNNLLHSNWI